MLHQSWEEDHHLAVLESCRHEKSTGFGLGEQAIQIKGPQCLLHLTGKTGFRYFHMSMLK